MDQSGRNNPNYKHGKTIENKCKRCDCLIDHRAIHCVTCKNIVIPNHFKGKTHSEKTKKIIGMKSKKKFTPEYIKKMQAKHLGSKKRAINGYTLVKDYTHPNRNSHDDVLEHVYVMSEHLGRPLKKGEIIHHINMVRDDNRLENLYLCKRNNHLSFHASMNKLVKDLLDKKIIQFKDGVYTLI